MKFSSLNTLEKSLLKYLIISYGLAVILSLWIGFSGGQESKFLGFGLMAMFFPAIAVLIMKYVYHQNAAPIGWNKFDIKWLLVAILIFPTVIHCVCLPIELVLNDNTIPWESLKSRGWDSLSSFGLIWRIALNAVVGMLAISVFAFFEEIGWRVWMLPRLVEKYNVKRGVLIGAIIWALWHIPFVLSEIHNISGTSKIWLLLLNPLGHIGAGIVISWLWLKTKSIWIITLAHGSLNNWGQYAFKFIRDDNATQIPWLLVGLNLSLLTLGFIVLWKGLKPKNLEYH
jgi:membrane protease YdiL (CAAX protease family)